MSSSPRPTIDTDILAWEGNLSNVSSDIHCQSLNYLLTTSDRALSSVEFHRRNFRQLPVIVIVTRDRSTSPVTFVTAYFTFTFRRSASDRHRAD